MAAPTFVQEAGDTWSTTNSTAAYTTGAFSVTSGNVLAALGAISDTGSWTLAISNSGTAHSWGAAQQTQSGASFCLVSVWAALAAATQSNTVSFTRGGSGSSMVYGGDVLEFSASDGLGTSSKTSGTGGPSLSITTTQANSAIVVFVADWNAADGASRTWRTVNGITPTAGNGLERTYFRDASNYTVYGAYYSDAGATGAKTVGLSAPTGQKYSIVAFEVKGTAGGGGTAFDRSLSDTVGVTDSMLRTSVANRAYTQNLGVSDSTARLANALRAYTDNLGVSDAFARVSVANRSVIDTLGLADAVLRVSAAKRSMTDNLGVSDAFARLSVANRAILDAMGLSDAILRQTTAKRAYTDNAGVSDAYLRQLAHLRRLTDNLGLADSAALVKVSSGVLLIAVADALGLADTAARRANALRALTDALGLADSAALVKISQGVLLIAVADALGLSDSARRIATGKRALTDVFGLTDSMSRQATYSRLLVDTLALIDAAALVLGAGSLALDNRDGTGTANRNLSATVSPALVAVPSSLMTGLVAAYSLNGTLVDAHTGGLNWDNGTPNGYAAGLVAAQALFTDSTAGVGSVLYRTAAFVDDGPLTVEAWVYPPTAQSDGNPSHIWTQAQATSFSEMEIVITKDPVTTDVVFRCQMKQGEPLFYTMPGGKDGWHHFVMTFDGVGLASGTMNLYVDGVLRDTRSTTPGYVISGFTVDRSTLGGEWAAGPLNPAPAVRIGPLRVWERDLTGGEVTSLYNLGAGRAYPFVTYAMNRGGAGRVGGAFSGTGRAPNV